MRIQLSAVTRTARRLVPHAEALGPLEDLVLMSSRAVVAAGGAVWSAIVDSPITDDLGVRAAEEPTPMAMSRRWTTVTAGEVTPASTAKFQTQTAWASGNLDH